MAYFRDDVEACADCPALNQLPPRPRCNLQRRTLTDDEWTAAAEECPEWCPLREGDAVIRLSVRMRP